MGARTQDSYLWRFVIFVCLCIWLFAYLCIYKQYFTKPEQDLNLFLWYFEYFSPSFQIIQIVLVFLF